MDWRQVGKTWREKLNQRRWRIALTVLLLGPAVALIAFRTYQNWGVLQEHSWQLHPERWAGALLGYSLALFCLLWAWDHMLAQLGHERPFRNNARIYCLSNLAKRIPGGIWYMAGRVHLYQDERVPATVTLTGTALEVVLLATTGMAAFFLTLPFSQGGWPSYLGLALAVLLVAVFALQPPVFNRVLRFLLRRMGSETQLEITYSGLLPLLLGYLGGWVFAGAGLYMAILSFYDLPWNLLPDIVGLWALSGTLSMLASTLLLLGMGVREIALSFLLTVHMPQPIAIVAAVLFWFVITAGELLWTGTFVLLGRLRGQARPIPMARTESPPGAGASMAENDPNVAATGQGEKPGPGIKE